ncbi:type II toxin-antitoxin system PrlF family antitoxin [Methylobacterium sp. E-065]|uniref:type II toxin-antitoxin system PrlF family antitoxin n=1 Tax=Methylobacterium sp. E-065 TaxID=2836583 RepID=UPI002443B6A6|nr:type II toxin-antitoxin system PrlF family antitoxin [Methylobacterium sp. E-065]
MVLERDATVTDKGQMTVPKPVRDILRISPGDRIRFRIDGDRVSLHRVTDQDDADPVVTAFLTFLASDMTQRPQAIAPLTPDLAGRIADLVGGIAFDPDEDIDGAVAL